MDGSVPSYEDAGRPPRAPIPDLSGRVGAPATLHQSELDRKFRAIWDFGRVALIGCCVIDNGVNVLAAPVLSALETDAIKPHLVNGAGVMDADIMIDLAGELRINPVPIDLDNPVGSPDGPALYELETAMRPYCISTTKQRGVGLLDISGFSLFTPEEQAAQLSMLSYALNSAHQKLSESGLNIDLASTTTGDGFYLWNRHEGLDEDASLFCLMTVALAHMALQYREVRPSFAPAVRACFGIGSHYTYFRPDHANGMGGDYIVGDVTIALARLIDHAKSRQIMISDFSRDNGNGHMVGTEDFLEQACQIFNDLQIIKIGDAAIAGVSRYLTGPQNDDGTYAIRKREIIDKHGFKHYAYNAKLNISLTQDGDLYLGRQEAYAA
jgi:hypothetical protein